jgi:hypothetical protein
MVGRSFDATTRDGLTKGHEAKVLVSGIGLLLEVELGPETCSMPLKVGREARAYYMQREIYSSGRRHFNTTLLAWYEQAATARQTH